MPEGVVSQRAKIQIDDPGYGSSLFNSSRPIEFAWRSLASIWLLHRCIASKSRYRVLPEGRISVCVPVENNVTLKDTVVLAGDFFVR